MNESWAEYINHEGTQCRIVHLTVQSWQQSSTLLMKLFKWFLLLRLLPSEETNKIFDCQFVIKTLLMAIGISNFDVEIQSYS